MYDRDTQIINISWMIGLYKFLYFIYDWITRIIGLYKYLLYDRVSRSYNKYFMYDRDTRIINISCMIETHE
jgi:hypothetical protein